MEASISARARGPNIPRDFPEVEPEQAHHPVDDEAPHHVVVVHRGALHHREDAGLDLLGPVLELVGVLRVGAAQVGDGAHAEGDRVGGRTDGVALEVADEAALVLGAGHLVGLQREVVEADEPVAVPGEGLHRVEEEGDPLRGPGQRRLGKQPLVRLHPRYVGEPEHRQAIGPHGQDALQGALPGLAGLEGQPVDEVEVHALEAVVAGRLDQVGGLLLALDAPHRLLHLGVEVLDPHGDAVEAQPRRARRSASGW